jgi:hypothetical protein
MQYSYMLEIQKQADLNTSIYNHSVLFCSQGKDTFSVNLLTIYINYCLPFYNIQHSTLLVFTMHYKTSISLTKMAENI